MTTHPLESPTTVLAKGNKLHGGNSAGMTLVQSWPNDDMELLIVPHPVRIPWPQIHFILASLLRCVVEKWEPFLYFHQSGARTHPWHRPTYSRYAGVRCHTPYSPLTSPYVCTGNENTQCYPVFAQYWKIILVVVLPNVAQLLLVWVLHFVPNVNVIIRSKWYIYWAKTQCLWPLLVTVNIGVFDVFWTLRVILGP